MIRLHYIGRIDGIEHLNIDPRMWDVMSHYIDKTGRDQFKNTVMLEGLKEIGIVPMEVIQ